MRTRHEPTPIVAADPGYPQATAVVVRVSRAWAKGSTRAWRRTRARILIRDRYQCRLRIPGVCTSKANCVHHTLGKGVSEDPAHLVASCTPCNLHIGQPSKATDPAPQPRTRW